MLQFEVLLVVKQPLGLGERHRNASVLCQSLQFLDSPEGSDRVSKRKRVFFGPNVLSQLELCSKNKFHRPACLLNELDGEFAGVSYLQMQRIAYFVGTLNYYLLTRASIFTPNCTFFTKPTSASVLIVIFYFGFIAPSFT